MENTSETVFDYIKREESEFQTTGVPLVDGWDFEMYKHIRFAVLYKHGQLDSGKTENKPVENIILPILNVAYRSEDIDVKDIIPYVDDKKNYHKSLLVKKFHDRWAREFEIDTFLDNLKISKIDFGLVLVKNNKDYPEIVPLQRLAFCDQTDILSGPICEKHQLTIDQLLEMKGKWDSDAIDEVVLRARSEKAQQQVKGQKQKTPGKYIEVYELHGVFKDEWNPKIENPEEDKYSRQIHIVTYCATEEKKDNGVALYQGSEKEQIYDALKRDEIYGRACGFGGIEELIEPQVWHTYSAIQKKEMLDIASAMIVKTTDPGLAKRQRITGLEKGEILEVEEGKDASQLFVSPINWEVFDSWQDQMKSSAQTTGSANDPQLGVEPKSGTPFRLQRLTTAQGQGIHQYRRGLMATFIEKLYRKWFLKYLVKEINKGDEWLDELDLKELQWVSERVAVNQAEEKKKELILSGKLVTQEEIDSHKEEIKRQWAENGREKFIKVVKDEFSDIPIDVKVNVANKQKDLDNINAKIIDFLRAIIQNPGLLNNPGWADLMNQVIEYSGLNPVDFSEIKEGVQPANQQQAIQQPAVQQQMAAVTP